MTDHQIGDLVVLRVPLGGAGTVKIISGLGGLTSFFGVSRFIHYKEATILEESGIALGDMFAIMRELKMDMQEYVKRLWRFYRYPFVI